MVRMYLTYLSRTEFSRTNLWQIQHISFWKDLLKVIQNENLQCTYHTTSTTVKMESESVAASIWDMFASLVSTMVRLTRDAMVVHVAYMARPFWTCSRDSRVEFQRDVSHNSSLWDLMLNTSLESSVRTHQDTVEPQVNFVVFVEPGSVAVKTVAGEEYHHVVSWGDQDEENHCGKHQPLIGTKKKQNVRYHGDLEQLVSRFFTSLPMKSDLFDIHVAQNHTEYICLRGQENIKLTTIVA